MEAALRGGLEQSLTASATAVAAALEEQDLPLCAPPNCVPPAARSGTTIYAPPLRSEVAVDGVREDWNVPDEAAVVLDGGHRVWAGVQGRYAYLFVAVRDDDLVYPRRPGE